jgi:hypothetical protein
VNRGVEFVGAVHKPLFAIAASVEARPQDLLVFAPNVHNSTRSTRHRHTRNSTSTRPTNSVVVWSETTPACSRIPALNVGLDAACRSADAEIVPIRGLSQ